MTHFKLEADSGLLGSHQKPMQKGEMQQEGKEMDMALKSAKCLHVPCLQEVLDSQLCKLKLTLQLGNVQAQLT